MKFIPPLEITSKLMTLIEEAKKELIIVSPYVNVSKWGKMKSCLERAINRGVKVTIIARKNADQDLSYIQSLNVKLHLIMDLHAKLYLNDKYGIVTSQNLLQYSDNNSIEIAYQTNISRERIELVEYVNSYIINLKPNETEKILVNEIENKSYENKKQLPNWQVNKILEHFKQHFPDSRFVGTETYVFCGSLLPFADVMMDSIYTVKFRKGSKDCEEILKKLVILNLKLNHKFKIDVLTSHKSYYYVEFIPTGQFQLLKLIEDFMMITNTILDNNIGINSSTSKKAVW